MKKSFIVIGLGRFGLSLIKTLGDLKRDVLAIDINEDSVSEASQYITHCVVCDATKIHNLEELGVSNIDHAIIAIGNNLQASILTMINLKELGVKQITVRVDQDDYKSIMEKLGADEVIIPEEASAVSLANQIISESVVDYHAVAKGYGIVQIQVPGDYQEVSLIDLNARNKFDVNVVAIIRNDQFFIPKGTDSVLADDIIIVIGQNNKVAKFEHYING